MKPIPATTPSRCTDRTTSRINLTSLKPAEDFFFSPPFPLSSFFLSVLLSFCIPSSFHPLLFYSFFLPSFIYYFVLIFDKFPSSYLSSNLFYSFFLPSFPFLFPFSPPSLLHFFPLLSLLPTGETIKPGALKRPGLDHVRSINVSSRPVSTGD